MRTCVREDRATSATTASPMTSGSGATLPPTGSVTSMRTAVADANPVHAVAPTAREARGWLAEQGVDPRRVHVYLSPSSLYKLRGLAESTELTLVNSHRLSYDMHRALDYVRLTIVRVAW
jgi:hypothetical protein